MIFRKSTCSLAVLAAMMFTSCTSDDNPVDSDGFGKMVDVTFEISAPAGFNAGSRASHIDPSLTIDPAVNENIHTWTVVLVNTVGGVDKVYKVLRNGTIPDEGVERNGIRTQIPADDYTVYAFANISDSDIESATGLTLSEGAAVGDINPSAWNFAGVFPEYTLNSSAIADRIPMTGKMTITATEAANQSFAIEVVRLVAKMSFSFATDAEGTSISVKGISLLPAHTGVVDLFPTYGFLNSDENRSDFIPEGTPAADFATFTFDSPLTVTSAQSQLVCTYIRETSAASHPTGRFVLGVSYERDGVDNQAQFALTEISTIYRNDHIYIPVSFTEYFLELETRFYPPIGGYPAVLIDAKDNEYFVKFGTQGAFDIRTILHEGTGDGAPLPLNAYSVEIGTITDLAGNQLHDGEGIFTRLPALNAATGEITGELSSGTGTAIVPVTVKIRNSANVERVFNRTIYIIRENQ